MAAKKKEYSKYVIAADAVGIVLFIIANIALLLGEFTNIFKGFGGKNPGIHFIFEYLCAPVYRLVEPMIGGFTADTLAIWLGAELVIIASSIIYAFLIYVIFRILGFIYNILIV